jgi:hypothetical protein
MNNIYCFSHRRSGTFFLKESLIRNFQISFALRHFEIDNPKLYPKHRDEPEKHPIVNMIRDGRDVMVACYHYYSTIKATNFIYKGKTFREFLHGNVDHPDASEIDFQHWTNPMFDDPIQYWMDFVSGWLNRGYPVKFEDLKINGKKTIVQIGQHFELKRSEQTHIQEVTELVGVAPRKGIIGDWMHHFSYEDHEFFWQKAGNLMGNLGYER